MLRQRPDLDIVRIQDVALSGADDRTVLEWAAGQGRVLLTHDVTTLTRYAYDRARAGQPLPGVFGVSRRVPLGQAKWLGPAGRPRACFLAPSPVPPTAQWG